MAQQDRPQRSLRKDGGGPRYYRDWSAAQSAPQAPAIPEIPDGDYDDEYAEEDPQELQMVDGLDPAAPPRPPQELAPLNVIVPEGPLPGAAAEPKKPTITRVDKSKIQRARRYNEIQAEEEEKKKEEAAREAAARQAPPEQSPRTRNLAKPSAQTTELETNLKEIEGKLDEAKENVKTTANALSDNIRQLSERITDTVVGSIQNVSKGLNSWISRFGKGKAGESESGRRDEDFEDEPLPGQTGQVSRGTARGNTAQLPEVPADSGQPAAPPREENLLDRIGSIPPVQYAALLKEGVLFQTFDKQALVEDPESYDPQPLQALFVENALQDIRKCVKLVRELPDPTEGPYAGIPMAYIFKHIREHDLYYFMHYVLSKPEPFRKKTFKISEAFGTWILKRSASTVVAEAFPEVLPLAYYQLYKDNIRFQTFDKKQLVLASGKTPEEVDALFLERAQEDVRSCVGLVEKFPAATQGPYKGRPLKQIFKGIKPRDIYFFLHYVQAQPEVFRGQNFKFSEAFASWILKRSHETELPG
ncbi:MAG: hypothetical protein ACAI44_22265 [Candidatus Sericytochromatia bacterium]